MKYILIFLVILITLFFGCYFVFKIWGIDFFFTDYDIYRFFSTLGICAIVSLILTLVWVFAFPNKGKYEGNSSGVAQRKINR